MTELLYATDAYLKEVDAVVQEIRDGAVILDRTVFYATGGGQPHDTGTLTWTAPDGGRGECRVVEVRKQGPDVLHKIEGEAPPVGATVHGQIDWDRRYALMRHHTALHSMSGVIYRLHGALGHRRPDVRRSGADGLRARRPFGREAPGDRGRDEPPDGRRAPGPRLDPAARRGVRRSRT